MLFIFGMPVNFNNCMIEGIAWSSVCYFNLYNNIIDIKNIKMNFNLIF